MKKALIIGFGSAGHRQAELAYQFGFDPTAVDPVVEEPMVRFTHMEQAWHESWDVVVICTPPDLHLDALEVCAALGVPTLCEKPLCGFGQLERARKLASFSRAKFAFNYRFHPALVEEKWDGRPRPGWALVSSIHRPSIPPWGLILDHLSHAVDILFWKVGGWRVERAEAEIGARIQRHQIWGCTNDAAFPVYLFDQTYTHRGVIRIVKIYSPFGRISIDAGKKMFENLWAAFLDNTGVPTFDMALRVQEHLERIKERCQSA